MRTDDRQPRVSTDLHYLSAVEAIRLFRARTLSPVELMDAVIARADAVEPCVNALTDRYVDAARAAARRAEERYGGRGPRPRPLEGIPVAVKEELAVKGQRHTLGSLVFRERVADHTAPLAERVIRAGGIIHARTTIPEFACAPFTHSRLSGVTRNPWNAAYDVGGSSGGSAAALAAGMATLATGSDIGGSLRLPAAACGVIGYKPPYGRVPQDPPFNLDHYRHDGPLARSVADCALLQNVIAGPHPRDVASLRPKLRLPRDLPAITGWRIALSVDLGGFPVDEEVARNTRAAAAAFREAGATVEEVEIGWNYREIIAAAHTHFSAILYPWVGEMAAQHRDQLTRNSLRFADEATAVTKADLLRGLAIEARIYARLGELFRRYRLLICPTLSVPALEAGEDYVDRGPIVNGVERESLYEVMMTLPFNVCSRCPVMSIPSGYASTGVPTGLQIVGRTYDDVSVFRAAATLERLRPGSTPQNAVPPLVREQ